MGQVAKLKACNVPSQLSSNYLLETWNARNQRPAYPKCNFNCLNLMAAFSEETHELYSNTFM